MDEENYSYQIQEIEVLKSIYGEDLFSEQLINDKHQSHDVGQQECSNDSDDSDDSDGSDEFNSLSLEEQHISKKSFNIKISIDIPKDFQIIVKEDQENKYTQSILCLPNINLLFSFPSEYPSNKPPKLFISSCWLSLGNMNLVLEHLYSIWEKDELVIFKYVDWLKTNLLQFLQFEKGIVLDNEPVDFESALWKNVGWDHDPSWVSLLSALPTLRSYNSHEGRRLFLLNSQVCSICDYEGCGQEFTLFNCLHHICNDCVSNIVNINIKSNDFSSVKCPELKCKESFDLEVVEKFIEKKEDLKRYEDYLKQSKGLVRCLRCERGWSHVDHLTRSTYCTSCYYSFCIVCRGPFHPGVACNFTKIEGAVLSKFYIGQLRVCLCGALIERISGCNKMTCSVCNTKFCWLCSKSNIDYDHFGKKCQLFEIPGERNRGGGGNRVGRNIGVVDASTSCSKCRQIVYRHSNTNSVYCHGCDARYCFLCKVQIKGTRHFIQTSCTQNGKPDSWKADRTYKFYGGNETAPEPIYINQDVRHQLFR
ncbi:hypothetical protein DICPUDRAFT_85528 [Dictyostelium purpureum]|uniref:RBR-type E3 ubiquitin transferase n=1 Tax=Dictyostelium purpureum TaxID=5786 RepID=F1A610_DICPU|nr:uncharacterized protein DICPUDRAFT_85528 [Dictyostelium purpureum]EGC28367.1 hypothetical protein DICPUDRAFT_85528 [Dictyostelium purpureum]|eukprot:XP_003295104.1 hypothetical protein DICPUDRAFT_85528 [Dictyostelium purpureum]